MALGKREQVAVGLGVVLALVIALYAFVLAPALERNDLLDRLIRQRHQDVEEMISLQRRYAGLAGDLAQVKERWLATDDSFSLLSFLEEQANDLGIRNNIVNIRPRNLVYGKYRELQADVQMEKIALDSLIRYLYRIEYAPKPLNVGRLNIRSRAPREGTLNVTMLVSVIQKMPLGISDHQ